MQPTLGNGKICYLDVLGLYQEPGRSDRPAESEQ